jgi:hypothetical protein
MESKRGITMKEPVLQISQKKYTEGSTVISLRLPKDMVRDIDQVASQTGRTRNEIMTMSLEFALNHMEIVTAQVKSEE